MPDIVYPVRPGEVNEELRYSLRSLHAHVPDVGTVWVIGYAPGWLTGVEVIPGGNPTNNSHANVYRNVLMSMQHEAVAEDVVVFNDDFFITAPVETLPVAYRSTLAEHLNLPRLRTAGKSWWKESLQTTQVCLQAFGITDPLSYELHVPFPCSKGAMRETLERFAAVTPDNPPQWRTLYGNLMLTEPGVQLPDSKAFNGQAIRKPFLSTTDLSWRNFRTKLAAMFPDPSPYEQAVSPMAVRRA